MKILFIIKPFTVDNYPQDVPLIKKMLLEKFDIIEELEIEIQENQVTKLISERSPYKTSDQTWNSMLKGNSIVMLLDVPDVASLRAIVGKTFPEYSEPGTIREKFGHSIIHNVCYYSSADNYAFEVPAFFPQYREELLEEYYQAKRVEELEPA